MIQLWPSEHADSHYHTWIISLRPPTPGTCPKETHSHGTFVPMGVQGENGPEFPNAWTGRTPWEKPWYVAALWRDGAEPTGTDAAHEP